MKYYIFFFSLAITANAKSQSNLHTDSLMLYHHHFRSNNTFLESQYAFANPEQFNTDNFVLKLPASKLTYTDQSNSFDIYKATPDNMFVAKPDDTIAFNMPVAGKPTK